MSSAILVGVLVAGGVFLVLQRGLIRMAFGIVMIGNAANVMLLASGGTHRREAAVIDQIAAMNAAADPLPQAFVLTAIVITFGVVVFLVALAGAGGSDDTEPAGQNPEPGGGHDGLDPVGDATGEPNGQVPAVDATTGGAIHATGTTTTERPEEDR
ncbi:NADH-quinone oxidoreductase subunit K [Spiractinospora alimapuensis]|uniref:sodium:proton antiporter n=1 Tax=Spiractinospora alimapuensis TaxID=2820884 RepID=UPI002ED335D9|nr:NADH-quinone oxidoreductase subunit K [Spiractinospora alimapuensis]